MADLEKQPIGAAVGKPAPGQADIELVKTFLESLGDNWESQPNDLKNSFLRLLLDKIIIWPDPATIRVKLVWRVGIEQELLIYRPKTDEYRKWDESEIEIIRKYYVTGDKDKLLSLLPDRTWEAIRCKGINMGLHRNSGEQGKRGMPYAPQEDEIVRRYYTHEISASEAEELTGRVLQSIKQRARLLGLTWQPRKAKWAWIDNGIPQEDGQFWSTNEASRGLSLDNTTGDQ